MPTGMYLLIGLVCGGLFGWVVGWLYGRGRAVAPDDRLSNELRAQLAQRETDLASLREQLTQAASARAAAEASRSAAERLIADQRELHERTKETQEKALVDLKGAFKALSVDTLRELQPHFIERVSETVSKLQETAKGDLAQRQEAIKGLVRPLEEQLKIYQQRLQQSESTQSKTLGEVEQHLKSLAQQSLSLSNETLQLRRVLSSNQARGRWGEETLRRVVEAAGMSALCDFSEQTKEGDGKPDLVVRLPGNRVIIVDAKVPDLDFLNALDAADSTKRVEALAAHAAKMKATVKALADRDYPAQFSNALDYVVLFLPAESLFSAALEGDQDLIVWAASKRIMLATPASLIALLRSVSVSWQQHSQTENSRAIAEAAEELYSRVCILIKHLAGMRAGLERSNAAFNDVMGSYDRMVRPSGERLLKLRGDGNGKELAEIPPLDGTLRHPPAQEDLRGLGNG